ncbi:zf-HC2 domain-containing protein [Streptomyces sp. NPDC002790]|uniref:zf-HC2 domain-containing protein n=1 Tax=Streptomyces sp. NPDC002790 TaxID=3154431 RepID=UPI00332E91E5
MTAWHVSEQAAQRYAAGSLLEPDCWSVERHVEACEVCAARVSGAVTVGAGGVAVAAVRELVLGAVRFQAPAAFEQAFQTPPAIEARGPGRSPVTWGRGAWWAVGRAVRGAWLVALFAVAAGALALAHGAHFTGALPLLLTCAPIVPVAGVAASYGRHTDPLHEIAASTPRGGLPLLLARTGTVLAVAFPVLAVTGLLLPSPTGVGPGPAAWLLPGLALTLATLALGGYVGVRAATAVIGGGWLVAVAVPAAGAGPQQLSSQLSESLALYFNGPAAQSGWAAALVLCAALITVRRASYDLMETP